MTQLDLVALGYTKIDRNADKPNGTVAVKTSFWDWDYYTPLAPQPLLPTAPWTVIRVIEANRMGYDGKVLTRSAYGQWYNAGIQVDHRDLQKDIRKFELLAEPVVDDGF
jgi:hypothetical protein